MLAGFLLHYLRMNMKTETNTAHVLSTRLENVASQLKFKIINAQRQIILQTRAAELLVSLEEFELDEVAELLLTRLVKDYAFSGKCKRADEIRLQFNTDRSLAILQVQRGFKSAEIEEGWANCSAETRDLLQTPAICLILDRLFIDDDHFEFVESLVGNYDADHLFSISQVQDLVVRTLNSFHPRLMPPANFPLTEKCIHKTFDKIIEAFKLDPDQPKSLFSEQLSSSEIISALERLHGCYSQTLRLMEHDCMLVDNVLFK